MNVRFAAAGILFVLMFSACATKAPDQLSARRRAYERLLKNIEPGMTRRQLYAILPPRRTPDAFPPRVNMVISMLFYSLHTESHELDRDFSILTQYRLANLADYPMQKLPPSGRDAVSFKRFMSAIAHQRTGPYPSRENPDDELARRPILQGPGIGRMLIFSSQMYSELTVPKSAERKAKNPAMLKWGE